MLTTGEFGSDADMDQNSRRYKSLIDLTAPGWPSSMMSVHKCRPIRKDRLLADSTCRFGCCQHTHEETAGDV